MTASDTCEDRCYALAVVAHELRSPLTAALGSLHALRFTPCDDRMVNQTCTRIERQLRTMAALVEDLLDLSRADLGKLGLRRKPLELVSLVRISVEDHRSAIFRAGLTATLAAPSAPIWIAGDELRLRQVLGNLLDNAEKFTPSGGSIAVSVSADEEARQALLRVRDTGEGIEPGVIGRIFDPFAQAEGAVGRANGGFGLGLALVKRLVERHGGTVDARSEGSGKGSEFTVRLPTLPTGEATPSAGTAGVQISDSVHKRGHPP